MTINELNNALSQALKNYIKSSSHNDTGRLINSIKFNCIDNKGLKIKFNAMEYIHYLDDGKFIDEFFSLSSTIDLIAEYQVNSIEATLMKNIS